MAAISYYHLDRTIELAGEQGNVFALVGLATSFVRQLSEALNKDIASAGQLRSADDILNLIAFDEKTMMDFPYEEILERLQIAMGWSYTMDGEEYIPGTNMDGDEYDVLIG